MLYITLKDGKAVSASTERTEGAISRWDYTSAAQVTQLARELFEATGRTYLGIETGVRPQWDIIAVPMVGDKVSYGFNGDYYPCGEITHISPTYKKITTSDGSQFYRQGNNSGCWKKNKTWSLIAGVHSERNPHI